MQGLTFKRGVHPPDGKALSADQPIKVILPKENSELFYPMSQHIGAPCDPLVAVGDHVKVGQKIAESGAFMSSPIFASVSGEVVDIRPMLVPGGGKIHRCEERWQDGRNRRPERRQGLHDNVQ